MTTVCLAVLHACFAAQNPCAAGHKLLPVGRLHRNPGLAAAGGEEEACS